MNLLITGAWQNAKENIDSIEKMGHTVVFMQYEKDELPCDYLWVEGVICNGLFLSHPINKFENLKYIQLTSAGYDRVPMDYVKEHNIEIYNARGVYSIPMAEFAVSGVLQLYKNSKFFIKNQQNKIWEKDRNLIELYGKTVCIVGCGSVGTECAKRFKAFGCKIFGVDLVTIQDENYDYIMHLEKLDEILPKSDVVILTLPLTKDTYHIIDKKRLDNFKEGSVLVNIARGAIVDTEALITALENKLYGAVLDVFEDEPLLNDSNLWNFENVILTPHNSFVGDKNFFRLNSTIFLNLIRGKYAEQ